MINIPEPTVYLRVDKPKKDGRMPLYVRFPRIDGEEPKFPMGLAFLPEEWDGVAKLPLDSTQKLIVEKEIGRIKGRIYNVLVNGEELTKSLLRDIVANKKPENLGNASFYDFFDEYVAKGEKSGKLKPGTVKTYETTRRSLKEYRGEIRVRDINEKLISGFENFLIKRGRESGRGDVLGSRANRLKHLRTIILNIERHGIPVDNPYRRQECSVPQTLTNDVFLEYDELRRMYSLTNRDVEFGSNEMRILLMYLFSCAVGIRLSDALCIKWGNLDVSKETIVVHLIPKKGDKPERRNREIHVPLSSFGESIISMTANDDFDNVQKENTMFQIASQSTINPTLKKLAKMARIEKNISYHSARRTFATLAAVEGADAYTIKNYMGHKNVAMAERYMKWSLQLARESAAKTKLIDIAKILGKDPKKK